MRTRLAVLLATLAMAAFASASAANAADLFPPGSTGYDRSFPDCNSPAPTFPYAFAIIGATGGRAFTHNPCLAAQYAAAAANGHQPSLYMNMKSPVGANAEEALSGPRGTCQASDAACQAYNFGYKTAQHAVSYATAQRASAASWWLDVETASSWSTDTAMNAVVIGAAIDFLRTQGATIGIYSTQSQWIEIAGSYRPALPVWVSAPDAATAPSYCSRAFGGGQVLLVQYIVGSNDFNYACTAADRAAVVESAPLGPPGSHAVVTTTDGDCLNVRPVPGFEGGSSGCLAPGTQVTVLDGSAVADGYRWQRISSGSLTGWVAGTFLRSVSAGGTATLNPAPTSSGVNASTWSGGSVTQLLAQAPRATSVWVFQAGQPVGFIAGAPAFANTAFEQIFPNGLMPSGTILFVVLP